MEELLGNLKKWLYFQVLIAGITLCIVLSGCQTPGAKGGAGGGGGSSGSGSSAPPSRPAPPATPVCPARPVSAGFSNDTYFSSQWALHNEAQNCGTADADIDAREAWALGTDCSNIIIGVIDTGIDKNHDDLRNNIWTNPAEIAGNGIDDDGNGYVDDTWGWNFAYANNNPTDDHSHGTHVAGTIGALGNNNKGVAGICWRARIMALKFLDNNGSGFTSDAMDAIDYATSMGVKITNNSWGGGGNDAMLKDAIDRAGAAGALFIAAAGNSGSNSDQNPMYPAAFTSSNIISVASTTSIDSLSSFSNYGANSVDIAAPGSGILSTIPANSYATYSGTSMASPHVAGATALLWHQNLGLTSAQVKTRLLQRVDKLPALSGRVASAGRLNLMNAVNPAWVSTEAVLLVSELSANELPVGEVATIEIDLENSGTADAEDTTITVSSADSAITISSNPLTRLGRIMAGARTAAIPFQLTIDSSLQESRTAELIFTVTTADGMQTSYTRQALLVVAIN